MIRFNWKNQRTNLLYRLFIVALLSASCHGLSTTDAASDGMRLLKTQDGYIINDSLEASEQELRLEDFFWTGSGDGPPHYVRRPNVATNNTSQHNRDAILKTATVVATVYVDQRKDTEPVQCTFDCEDEESGEISSDYFPEDRRYWLLTILGGHYLSTDFAVLEHQLASLYRIAFARQQLRHFGIDNQTQANPQSRAPPESTTTMSSALNQILPTKYSDYNNLPQPTADNAKVSASHSPNSTENPPKPLLRSRPLTKRSARRTTPDSPLSSLSVATTSASNPALFYSGGSSGEKNRLMPADISRPERQALPLRAAPSTPDDNGLARISVLVHNITLLSDDRQATTATPRQLLNATEQLSHSHSIANQTEIIYSVFVDGNPVLALTAARDMQWVTEDEVSRVMDKIVYTKAEPFLRDDALATPLAPPVDPNVDDATTSNQHTSVTAAILAHPVWIAIASILLLMVIVLFVGLVLMTRSKRVRSAQLKRLTAHRALIEESANTVEHSSPEGNKAPFKLDAGGNDNLAFENDGSKRERHRDKSTLTKTDRPVIHFPLPPAGSPSSSSTSDSSIYYPKRRSRLDIQHILDERAVNPFNKKPQKLTSDQEDALYATIDKRKERKLRQKRKHTNRVGSLEKDMNTGRHSSNSSADSLGATLKRTHYYDPVDAINLNAVASRDQHTNRVLAPTGYFGEDNGLAESPTETYNREVLKKLYREQQQQSSRSGSIGSYLSMASVRSFPKCSMPESLNRVLEPLSVMHLDQSDGGLDSGRRNRSVRVVDGDVRDELDVEGRLKGGGSRGTCGKFVRSQSDGADPGVIGPVVWEIHKRQIHEADVLSPIRDPAKTRSRFEGLLEGAINMYSGDISNEVINEINSTSDAVTRVRRKDVRLKTAIPSRKPGILSRSNTDNATRPLTAGAPSPIIEQPPSPYRRAWGSGAPSPLIRPLSAGPFHRPEPPQVDVVRVLAPLQTTSGPMLSTAPLIEAIQNELKKFDRPH